MASTSFVSMIVFSFFVCEIESNCLSFSESIYTCSEGEAVAAQTPEVTVTGSRSLDADLELLGSMKTSVRMALGGMLVLRYRDASASGLTNV